MTDDAMPVLTPEQEAQIDADVAEARAARELPEDVDTSPEPANDVVQEGETDPEAEKQGGDAA